MTVAVVFERLATVRIADVAVGIDVASIGGFVDRGGAADIVLADVFGCRADGDGCLVRLRHRGGSVVLAVHGTIRIGTERLAGACQRPAFVAGAFRRSCLRGVLKSGSELVYILDVDALAARASQSEEQPCASD